MKPESGCAFSVTLVELDSSSARFRNAGNDATCTSVFGWVVSSRARAKIELDWPVSGRVRKSIVFRACEDIVGRWVGGVDTRRNTRDKSEEIKNFELHPCRSAIPLGSTAQGANGRRGDNSARLALAPRPDDSSTNGD